MRYARRARWHQHRARRLEQMIRACSRARARDCRDVLLRVAQHGREECLERDLHSADYQTTDDVPLCELAVFFVREIRSVDCQHDSVEKRRAHRQVRVEKRVRLDWAAHECERVESIYMTLANLCANTCRLVVVVDGHTV